tara:strand:- start:976 stop:1395 length:420 start_codon:yes stop_codon:yes gene_type:complete
MTEYIQLIGGIKMPTWFSNKRSRQKDELVTIGINGVFRFNTAFSEKNLSSKPKYFGITNPEIIKGDKRVSFVFGELKKFQKVGIEPFSVDWTSKSYRCTVSLTNWFKENNLIPRKIASNYYVTKEKHADFGKIYTIVLL